MAFKAGWFNSALRQNTAMDSLTLQTIAMLCVTGIEAQIFLNLFTTSNMLRTKRENKYWMMVREERTTQRECSEAHVQAGTCGCFLGCSLFAFTIVLLGEALERSCGQDSMLTTSMTNVCLKCVKKEKEHKTVICALSEGDEKQKRKARLGVG